MRYLIVCLMLLAGCSSSRQIVERYGFVINENGGLGSCVAVGGGYFISASHVVYHDSIPLKFTVLWRKSLDSITSVILKDGDVVLIRTHLKTELSTVDFGRPKVGSDVYWFQPAFGKEENKMSLFLFRSMVSDMDSGQIILQSSLYPGASGSGIFQNDQLIGIGHMIRVFQDDMTVGFGEEIHPSIINRLYVEIYMDGKGGVK